MRSAVILAGGNSRRLGIEKSLLIFGNRPLLCWTAEKLSDVADEVVVVARNEQHAARLEEAASEFLRRSVLFAWDGLPGYGPVAGIAAGMARGRGRYAFATGCDLPFLSPQVVERLFQIAEDAGSGGAVPVKPNGFFEPLHSVYKRVDMQRACENAISRGERRIHAPLQDIGVSLVAVDLLRPLDCDLLTFFNLNTKEDLDKAKALWPGRRERRAPML
ncbi:MAG: molybdenum cofactor guanylyltransferase [Methanothrix sp.]